MCIYNQLLKLMEDFRIKHPKALSIKIELFEDESGQLIVEDQKSDISIIWANKNEFEKTFENYSLPS